MLKAFLFCFFGLATDYFPAFDEGHAKNYYKRHMYTGLARVTYYLAHQNYVAPSSHGNCPWTFELFTPEGRHLKRTDINQLDDR